MPTSLQPLAGDQAVGSSGQFYDIFLVQARAGPKIIVYMKLLFKFLDDQGLERSVFDSWTDIQKGDFVAEWLKIVPAKWNQANLTTAPGGRTVPLEFHFHARRHGETNSTDHWTITVKKEKGRSRVSFFAGTSTIFPDDLTQSPKGLWQSQTVALHEFSHMLGNKDEYHFTLSNVREYFQFSSISNVGDEVLPRHLAHIKAWADDALKQTGR